VPATFYIASLPFQDTQHNGGSGMPSASEDPGCVPRPPSWSARAPG